jgi:hypothetical protein
MGIEWNEHRSPRIGYAFCVWEADRVAHPVAVLPRRKNMKKNMPIAKVRKFLSPKEDIDVLRVYYCYQIGSTFVNLALMENTIIHGMMMCDRIKVSKRLEEDAPAWERLAQRTDHLQSSTLGNLVGILCRHGLHETDASYLKWVKEKRDFFIHRFFHNEPYPGDLVGPAIRTLCRRLLYLERIFQRAAIASGRYSVEQA